MPVLTKFASEFTNKKTLALAKKRITDFYKGIYGKNVVVVFTSWYGGKTGDKYGKNYWLNGYVKTRGK